MERFAVDSFLDCFAKGVGVLRDEGDAVAIRVCRTLQLIRLPALLEGGSDSTGYGRSGWWSSVRWCHSAAKGWSFIDIENADREKVRE